MRGQLSYQQKLGFSFLLVFGFLAVGLGFLQMRNTLYHSRQNAVENKNNLAQADVVGNVDTDQDGLPDSDEVNLYGTSAYLDDTDSDGLSDKTEVEAGTDPNCAKDTVCQAVIIEPVTNPATELSPLYDKVGILEQVGGNPSVTASSSGSVVDLNALLQNPAAIRELIKKSGKISESDLAKLSDEQLKAAVLEILKNDKAQ